MSLLCRKPRRGICSNLGLGKVDTGWRLAGGEARLRRLSGIVWCRILVPKRYV